MTTGGRTLILRHAVKAIYCLHLLRCLLLFPPLNIKVCPAAVHSRSYAHFVRMDRFAKAKVMSLKDNRYAMHMSSQSRGEYIQQYSFFPIPFLSPSPDYKPSVKWGWRTWMKRWCIRVNRGEEQAVYGGELTPPLALWALAQKVIDSFSLCWRWLIQSWRWGSCFHWGEKVNLLLNLECFVRSLQRIDAMCWNNFRSKFWKRKKKNAKRASIWKQCGLSREPVNATVLFHASVWAM